MIEAEIKGKIVNWGGKIARTINSLTCCQGWAGIATRSGLYYTGIESGWGRDFPHPSRPVLGSTQPPIQ
jgi:hypothetical protein